MADMLAAVASRPGPPSVLEVVEVPKPAIKPGWVLVKIYAFGLNRSEMFTRQGHSPSVRFPRILGIECVGVIEESNESGLEPGQAVMSAMGGMGRDYDGGYAEFALLPASQIKIISSQLTKQLGWSTLAALPELLQTAWGSLFKSLKLTAGDVLLIRGGTSSVGLAALSLAKAHGAFVASTTRSQSKAALLTRLGADLVLVDDGHLVEATAVKEPAKTGKGFTKVLELIGTATLKDSLACTQPGGIVCMSGILGNTWTLDGVNPMELIPTAVCLTVYSGGVTELLETPFDKLMAMIASGTLQIPTAKVFDLSQIVQAHELMESNQASGKIVVTTKHARDEQK